MPDIHRFLALDLGAESGRGIIATLTDGKISMEEIHRFANRPVRLHGTLYWDLPFLFAEILEAIRVCARRGVELDAISVDTWGVDFGLLDSTGALVGNPVHYRDTRTEGIHDYSDPIMPREEIFALTAYEPWNLSSLFQLLSLKRDGSALLDAAEVFLNIPDLLNYLLTGVRANELSIVNTSNLLAKDCRWAEPVMERFGLKRSMFGDLIEPATVLGPLTEEVRRQTGLDAEVPVVAGVGHDTSAAVAAVPATGDNWAFISCGTWSILGALIPSPIAEPICSQLGFTNEYTIGGWYLGRNISGLWPLQELRRKWNTADDPWDYDRMTAEASAAKNVPLVDAADDLLLLPDDMESALHELIARTRQPGAEARGELIHGVLASLALEYHRRLSALNQLTGDDASCVYLVGGGTANKLLCQLTANACGVPVHAGADQCTALGNALSQALALGILKSPQEIRQVMRNSYDLATYEPHDPEKWSDLRARYEGITRASS
jgi:rhamnulokinase